MTGNLTLLDPTGERAPSSRVALARPATLAGITVGLLDISKPRGNIFLDRLATALQALGLVVRRYTKPTFLRPAPIALAQQISLECQVLVEALAD